MSAVNKAIADQIIALNGYYMDDPRVTAVVSYTNKFNGEASYAITYAPQTTIGYFDSAACKDTKMVWNCYDTEFYFLFRPSSSLKHGYMKIKALTLLEAQCIFLSVYPEGMLYKVLTEEEVKPFIFNQKLLDIPFGYMPESL